MNPIVCQEARFTVLADGLIRMEHATDGRFVDEETLFAVNRTPAFSDFTAEDTGSELILRTARAVLTYRYAVNPDFTAESLQVQLLENGKLADVWFAGKKNEANLGGTRTTLDGINGFCEIGDGVISRNGWYLLDDSDRPILKDGWICDRAETHTADWYLFIYGKDYKLALRELACVSGPMAMPRKCVFGSWYSRWHPYTAEDFRRIVNEYDEHDFPLDILVMDMDWHWSRWRFEGKPDDPHKATTGFGWAGDMNWTGYSWCTDLIPDPDGLLKELKDRNVLVVLNDHPADGVRSCEDCYPAFMKQLGYRPEDGENLPFNDGDKRYMEAFYKCALRPIEKQGVAFWWVDWQQDKVYPLVPGMKNLKHLPWLNYLYYQHSQEDGKRGISYSRWGGYGDHKRPLHFSGDLQATWDSLKNEVPFTVTAANTGCFYWAHDTGGFHSEIRDPELYVRWVQFSMTTAALRLHSTGDLLDRRPWKWGERECNAIRRMFRLRSELLPYIYSLAHRAYTDSLPLLQPLYYNYPNRQEAYAFTGEYEFGPAFLAYPVCEKGQGEDREVQTQVWLPHADYYNFFTGEKAGGTRVLVTSPLETFPLFVRAGMPVPMQPYSRRMTSERPATVIIKAYPATGACENHFPLYEDDGETDAYKTGAFVQTDLGYARDAAGTVTLTAVPQGDGYDGMPTERVYRWELEAVDAPITVLSSSRPVTVSFDAASRRATVEAAACAADEAVTVQFAYAEEKAE